MINCIRCLKNKKPYPQKCYTDKFGMLKGICRSCDEKEKSVSLHCLRCDSPMLLKPKQNFYIGMGIAKGLCKKCKHTSDDEVRFLMSNLNQKIISGEYNNEKTKTGQWIV